MSTAEQITTVPMLVHDGGQQIQRTPMDMLNMAVARGDTQLAEKLMDLHERWERTQARKAFDAAIAAAKSEIPPIVRNKQVGYESKRTGDTTSYRHETFDEIARVVDPILSRYGLGYRFRTDAKPGQPIGVTCVLFHKDGHAEENSLWAPADTSGSKNAIQAIGSTQTYLCRYTLKAALGLAAADDDDGKAVGGGAITEEQADELMTLATDVGADVPRFLKYMKVDSITDIPAARFADAKKALEAKRGAK